MTDRVRRFWSACLRWAKLRPPLGHMEMLRGELSRREDERVAHDADASRKGPDMRQTERSDARE